MKQNVARWERIARTAVGIGMPVAGALAPLPLLMRLLAFGGGIYLLATALSGTCLGYKMLGLTSCPVDRRKTG